ncbi:hypothetical protein HG534_12975 [Moraxella osloensis]|nr:hypothetical protein [Moraxella osloensis]
MQLGLKGHYYHPKQQQVLAHHATYGMPIHLSILCDTRATLDLDPNI